MLDRIVEKNQLLELVDALSKERKIIGPVAREKWYFYDAVRRVKDLDLDFNYCVYSPKRFLFPPTEKLFEFDTSKQPFSAKPVFDDQPQAFIGVHPCDINAIRMLDRVFSRDHADHHYLTRRAATMIVGIDCPTECTEGIFCADMKANEAAEGFDVMCYPLERPEDGNTVYGMVFGTRAGREWILYNQVGRAPSVDDEKTFKQYQEKKAAAFQHRIPFDVDTLPGLLDRSYDSLLWEATARRCYSCGSCNLSCPTCYCFDVHDELDMTLAAGDRKREWDGCQLPTFALVAGGHNFRGKASSRLRHRIYRKGKWILEREGVSGCVGCARCDRACTGKINSVEIYNQLAEEV